MEILSIEELSAWAGQVSSDAALAIKQHGIDGRIACHLDSAGWKELGLSAIDSAKLRAMPRAGLEHLGDDADIENGDVAPDEELPPGGAIQALTRWVFANHFKSGAEHYSWWGLALSEAKDPYELKSHIQQYLSMYGVTNTLVFSLTAGYVLSTENIPSGVLGLIGYSFIFLACVMAGFGTITVAIFFNVISSVSVANIMAFVKLSSSQTALNLVNDLSIMPALVVIYGCTFIVTQRCLVDNHEGARGLYVVGALPIILLFTFFRMAMLWIPSGTHIAIFAGLFGDVAILPHADDMSSSEVDDVLGRLALRRLRVLPDPIEPMLKRYRRTRPCAGPRYGPGGNPKHGPGPAIQGLGKPGSRTTKAAPLADSASLAPPTRGETLDRPAAAHAGQGSAF